MTVDVVVHRFDFFVIFLCWDVHNKFRVEVISCRHTVLILFAQWNGVEDSDHRRTDSVSIGLESQSAFQCLLLDPVVNRYDIVYFVKSVSW